MEFKVKVKSLYEDSNKNHTKWFTLPLTEDEIEECFLSDGYIDYEVVEYDFPFKEKFELELDVLNNVYSDFEKIVEHLESEMAAIAILEVVSFNDVVDNLEYIYNTGHDNFSDIAYDDVE